MKNNRDFETAVKEFTSPAEEQWRQELSSWELVCNVWHTTSWAELIGSVLGALVILSISILLYSI